MDRQLKAGAEIPFETACNFRELGGYEAMDGRHVKFGLIYRGVALSHRMSQADKDKIASMNLKYILDLRAAGEAELDPDFVPEGVRHERICGLWVDENTEFDFSPGAIEKSMSQMTGDPAEMLMDFYRGMPLKNKAFKALFKELSEGNAPLLFHCSAGKDRTGTAAILILLALGVDEETAIADYLLTNVYRKAIIDKELEKAKKMFPDDPQMMERYAGKEGVLKEGAMAALDTIKKAYGTVEKYFEAEFGLDEEGLKRLRDFYLE